MNGAVLFGKLPAHGDFVSRGLTVAQRGRIDGWLSTSLVQARATLGDDFDRLYDGAMPWRCAGPGMAGAIAASQDAAGRRFPILLMKGDPDAAEHCETMLYRAISDRWTADRLAEDVGAGSVGWPDRWWRSDRRGEITCDLPQDLLTTMLEEAPEDGVIV